MTNDRESYRGYDLIQEHFPFDPAEIVNEVVIVRSTSVTVDDPAFEEHVGRLAGDLQGTGRLGRADRLRDGRPLARLARPARHARDGHPRAGRRRKASARWCRSTRPSGTGSRPRSRESSPRTRTTSACRRRTCRRASSSSAFRPRSSSSSSSSGRSSQGSSRDPRAGRDRHRPRADRARRSSLRALRLRREHADRHGPGARDRLCPLHRQPVPRGAERRGAPRSTRSPSRARRPAARCCSAARHSSSR